MSTNKFNHTFETEIMPRTARLHSMHDKLKYFMSHQLNVAFENNFHVIYSGPFASILGTLNPLQPSLSSGNVLFSWTSLGELTDSLAEGTPLPYN